VHCIDILPPLPQEIFFFPFSYRLRHEAWLNFSIRDEAFHRLLWARQGFFFSSSSMFLTFSIIQQPQMLVLIRMKPCIFQDHCLENHKCLNIIIVSMAGTSCFPSWFKWHNRVGIKAKMESGNQRFSSPIVFFSFPSYLKCTIPLLCNSFLSST
jgi:magnesium-transporting ATPase (P-type)